MKRDEAGISRPHSGKTIKAIALGLLAVCGTPASAYNDPLAYEVPLPKPIPDAGPFGQAHTAAEARQGVDMAIAQKGQITLDRGAVVARNQEVNARLASLAASQAELRALRENRRATPANMPALLADPDLRLEELFGAVPHSLDAALAEVAADIAQLNAFLAGPPKKQLAQLAAADIFVDTELAAYQQQVAKFTSAPRNTKASSSDR